MRGYSIIALDNPKINLNVGAAMRAVGCYKAAALITSGKRFSDTLTDTMKSYRHIPWFKVDDVMKCIPHDCVPVAVDLVEGATPLHEYKHPERAFYVFGAEDATLGSRVLDKCRDKVFIPTDRCMNLAATVNVILYDRLAKQSSK